MEFDFEYCMKNNCNSCKKQRECEEGKKHDKNKVQKELSGQNNKAIKRRRKRIYRCGETAAGGLRTGSKQGRVVPEGK